MSAAKTLCGVVNLHKVKNVHLRDYIRRTLSSKTIISSSDDKLSSLNLKPFSEIPRPRHYPVVGCLPFFLTSRDPKFDDKKADIIWKAMTKKFGPIIYFSVPGNPKMVCISNPEDIQNVYRATMDEPIRIGFGSLKKIRDETTNNYFEKKAGILPENHEEWRRVRSRVQTTMMKPKNIIKYLPQMDEITLSFMDRINDFQKQYGEMPADFLEELYKWSLESVGIVALNRRLGCFESNPISKQLLENVNDMFEALHENEMSNRLWILFETKHLRMLRKAQTALLEIVTQAINEAEEELKNKPVGAEATLLETFLQTDGLTRKDVVTFMLDMFFAGIDTTSHTVAFTLYCLSRNPEAQKRLQIELDTVLGDGKQTITETHLAKLTYLKSCVKEAMRIFPIVIGNVRTLTNDLPLSGYLVPKGIQVFMMGTVTSTDEKNFTRPMDFLPERWSRDKPLGTIHPFASVPFSHGSRMCIGRRIAEQEIYTFLARALHRFEVNYKYKDISSVTRLVALPSEPLKFEFSERALNR